MLLFQIFIAAFAFFALARAVKGYREGRLPRGWLGFWIVFWFLVVFFVLRPETTQFIATFFGVGRGVDLAIYSALIVLFYLCFRLFVKIEDVERELTRLVRDRALEAFDKERKK